MRFRRPRYNWVAMSLSLPTPGVEALLLPLVFSGGPWIRLRHLRGPLRFAGHGRGRRKIDGGGRSHRRLAKLVRHFRHYGDRRRCDVAHFDYPERAREEDFVQRRVHLERDEELPSGLPGE